MIEKKSGDRIDGMRFEKGFIALHVDDDVARERSGHFGEAVSSGRVVGARHDRGPAETVHDLRDALVIGRDQHGIDEPGLCGTSIDVLDHRQSGNQRERFTW
jgi:hypothetical protein